MVVRLIPLLGIALLLVSGCAGSSNAMVVEPTLVQVALTETGYDDSSDSFAIGYAGRFSGAQDQLIIERDTHYRTRWPD